MMRRTTIMLPEDLKSRAVKYAQKRGLSMGELIRHALEMLLSTKAEDSLDPFFSDTAVFRGKGPEDLVQNHDEYLYGEKN